MTGYIYMKYNLLSQFAQGEEELEINAITLDEIRIGREQPVIAGYIWAMIMAQYRLTRLFPSVAKYVAALFQYHLMLDLDAAPASTYLMLQKLNLGSTRIPVFSEGLCRASVRLSHTGSSDNSGLPIMPGDRNRNMSRWQKAISSGLTCLSSTMMQPFMPESATSPVMFNCIKDDNIFIRNVKEHNFVVVDGTKIIKGGKRVTFLWRLLCHLPSSLRKRVFIKLLEGSTDTGYIWLWNDGDEVLMEEQAWWREPPPWDSAAAALEVRLKKLPVLSSFRERIQPATPEMRIAMIAWLVVTSVAYKDADKERGYRSREEWDMQHLMWEWLGGLPDTVRNWLAKHSQGYDWRAFTREMMQAGHDCYQAAQDEWLFMRSQLFPTELNSIVHLGYKSAAPITCSACTVHTLDGGVEFPPPWMPPPALVALRNMWDHIDARRDFSDWLSRRPIYRFKEADVLFTEFQRDNDYHRYLPWVNTYPHNLRYTVTEYTLEEWRCMQDHLIVSESKMPLDFRTWHLAMAWQIIPESGSHSDHIRRFRRTSIYNAHLQSLPPVPVFDDFREAIFESGHICWEYWQMDDYAAAMTVLNEKPRVVGLDVRKDARCKVCRREWHVEHLAETFSAGRSKFIGDPAEVVVALMKKCSHRDLACTTMLQSVYQRLCEDEDGNSDQNREGNGRASETRISASEIMQQTLNSTSGHVELHNPHLVESDQTLPPETGLAHLPPISNFQHSTYGNLSNSLYPGSVLYQTSQIHEFPGVLDARNWTRSREMSVLNLVERSRQSSSVIFGSINASSIPDYNLQTMDYVASQTFSTTHPTNHGSVIWQGPFPAVDPTPQRVRSSVSLERSQTDADNRAQFSPTTLISSEHNRRMMPSRHGSPPAYTNTVPDSISLPSKREMMDEIKKFLTDAMGKHGIHLQHTDNNQPKLPWLDFESVLKTNKVRMINWPTGLKRPGKGLSKDPSKGIAGVKLQDLGTIYRAIHHPTNPIRFIPENLGQGISTSSGSYTMPEHTDAGPSRKRPRQDLDDEDMSQPAKHRGILMYFD
ncbi:hypothetical protein C8J56DRAFT_1081827 [Mycena floridula]|nr:hypothetical protein C8J56DRAFT_1081827 [Mycena floridula]